MVAGIHLGKRGMIRDGHSACCPRGKTCHDSKMCTIITPYTCGYTTWRYRGGERLLTIRKSVGLLVLRRALKARCTLVCVPTVWCASLGGFAQSTRTTCLCLAARGCFAWALYRTWWIGVCVCKYQFPVCVLGDEI